MPFRSSSRPFPSLLPIIVMSMIKQGPFDKLPPTIGKFHFLHDSLIPSYIMRIYLEIVPGFPFSGKMTCTSAQSGRPPIAATSLRLAAIALKPTS